MGFSGVVLLTVLVPLISTQTEITTASDKSTITVISTQMEKMTSISELSAVVANTTVITVDDNTTRIGETSKKSQYPEAIECELHHGLITNPFVESGCDHHFYSCDGFIGIRMECSRELFFDPDKLGCLPWHDVRLCSGITRTTSLPRSTVSRAATVTFDLKRFSCVHEANGNYADLTAEKPRCSQRYVTCDNGNLIVQWCLPNFYYDEYKDRCDVYNNVFDCTGQTIPPTTVHPASTRTHRIINFDCLNKTNGLYPNPLKKCDSKFYSCGEGIAREEECPNYLVYDPEVEKCHRKEDTFDCTGVHLVTTVAPSTRTPRMLPNFKCTGFPDGSLHADPEKPCADYFVQCWADQTVVMDCPTRLFFNSETKQCDYKWNVVSCRTWKWKQSTASTNAADLTMSTAPVRERRPWGMRGRNPKFPRPNKVERTNFTDPRIVF